MTRHAIILACVLLSGCDQSMSRQPKLRMYRGSAIWRDGTSARPLPPHIVDRSDDARQADLRQPAMSEALLGRGRERFDTFCSPCHGLAGHGDGMIVQRGFPAPPDFASPRLRRISAQHIFDVVTNGYGVMYSYAARVPARDRWAIAAYVRALQTSAGVAVADAPEAREHLQ
jgi:mono/diheme cytochrome c family protein